MLSAIGTSVEGKTIEAYVRRRGPRRTGRESARTVMILGGFHGDEPKSITLARWLISLLEHDGSLARSCRWIIVPVVNPDGYARRNRRNARRVDLNRNFPTRNWELSKRRSRMFGGDAPGSEPETQAVIRAIGRYKPSTIVTIHSISGHRHCNNYDGPAGAIARRMKRLNGYPVTATIGYPTPGSFGTWAGHERRIPTITLELPSHHSAKRCRLDNRDALLALA